MVEKASLKRLQLSNFKLEFLLNITLAINEKLSTTELLKRFEKILKNDLNIGKVLVYSYNIKWECILASGVKNNSYKDIHVENDLLNYSEITSLTSSTNNFLNNFDFVIPVFHKDVALAYVLIGDIDEESVGMSPTIKHLNFIQTLTNIIVVSIENKRLYNENLRQEALKKEIELASEMQSMLIPNPDTFPRNEKIYVAAYYQPHFEVGGDYYDFLKLNKTQVGFCIADVSGKGISAALLMSNFQANLRALFTPQISLTDLITILNNRVISIAKNEKFITLFVAKYNYSTKELQYINAGHIPPLLFNKKSSKINYLKKGCIGLGMFNEITEITEGSVNISQNSKLLCFTDGLVEVENENKVEFGTKPVENCISNDKRIDNTIDDIILKLNNYKGDNTIFDDISILGMEFY